MDHHDDDIKGFLDQEVGVSVRWLANALNVNVIEAASMMNKYHEVNINTIRAHYLISGVRKSSGKISFVVTSEDEISGIVDEFFSHTKQIFSIALIKSDNILAHVVQSDYVQARDCISLKSPCSASFMSNSVGIVKCSSVRFSDEGSRIAPIELKVSADKSHTSEISKQQQLPLLSAKPLAKVNLKAASTANSFFNHSSSVPKKDIPLSKSPAKVDSKSAGLGDDSDAEWEEVSTLRKSSNSKAVPTSKEAQKVPTHVSSAVIIGGGNELSSSPIVKRQKHVHGAMDDFMEDIAISKYIASTAASPEIISVKPAKKTKRKLVEKVNDAHFYISFSHRFYLFHLNICLFQLIPSIYSFYVTFNFCRCMRMRRDI